MIRLARLSIHRPRAVLAFWIVVAIGLGLIGLGVDNSLSPSVTVVPGTESARAQNLANARFGPTDLVPILLEGPSAQLNAQGPRLVRDLTHRPKTRALSAWDAGAASAGLRPNSNAAMIVVSVDRPHTDVVNHDQPQIERLVARDIHAPVRASVTGQASIDRALKSQTLDDTRRAELIAVAIVLALLLVGLRAPVAALLVTAVAAVTTLASFGLMTLLGKVMPVDPLSLATGTMSGLITGVALSLLILDRYHQEELGVSGRGPARDPALAASKAVSAAGPTILIIGTGLVGIKLLANALGTTKVLTSLGVGAATCELLATGAAVVIMPAALVLLGHRINAWSFPAPAPLARAWQWLVDRGATVRRRAVVAGAVATGLLAALAVPAFALTTGPPGVGQLPPHDKARLAFEEVARVMGPGWPTPYNVIIASNSGPITTASMLASVDRFQTQIAADPAVASVTGPGAISAQTKPLGQLSPSLNQSASLINGSKVSLLALQNGLGQAGSGASQLQAGLASAAAGAGQLHSGSGAAHSGAGQLHAGLAAARAGSLQLAHGLSQALSGANALKKGAGQALSGAGQLSAGLGTASTQVNGGQAAFGQLASNSKATSDAIASLTTSANSAASQVAAARSALEGMTAGKNDPQYAAALAALDQAQTAASGVSAGLQSAAGPASTASALAATVAQQGGQLGSGLTELHNGAVALQSGLAQLRTGNTQLAAGITQLSGGGNQLSSGLGRLQSGAAQLESGLGLLTTGSGQLGSGLATGVDPAGQLVSGLGVMEAGVAKFRSQLPSTKDLQQLRQQAPGLFNSGYFLLAAIAGAQPANANAATFTLNVDQGGSAAQILVVPRYPASDHRTSDLGDRLTALTKMYAARHNAVGAVGGPAGNLANYTSAANSRLPWVLAGLALFVFVLLALALRAVLLPVVAALFSLLTVAAGFGAMQILFGGSAPPLGGPGYLDPVSITMVFVAELGIALLFQVLLLTRAREDYLRTGDARLGLARAQRETAAAATGIGAVMIAAIVPFALTQVIPVREIGVAVSLVVAINVLIVRPVLLPAAMQLLGRRAWWPTRAGERAESEAADALPAALPAAH